MEDRQANAGGEHGGGRSSCLTWDKFSHSEATACLAIWKNLVEDFEKKVQR